MLSRFHPIPSTLNLYPKVFGYIHSHQRDKLDPRALKCIFLLILIPKRAINAFIPLQENTVSMDVQFCKRESYFSGNVSLVPLQENISIKEEEKLW